MNFFYPTSNNDIKQSCQLKRQINSFCLALHNSMFPFPNNDNPFPPPLFGHSWRPYISASLGLCVCKQNIDVYINVISMYIHMCTYIHMNTFINMFARYTI